MPSNESTSERGPWVVVGYDDEGACCFRSTDLEAEIEHITKHFKQHGYSRVAIAPLSTILAAEDMRRALDKCHSILESVEQHGDTIRMYPNITGNMLGTIQDILAAALAKAEGE